MDKVIHFPKSGKQVAVIPNRVFDPLNGWTLTVDHKLLHNLRDQGRVPSIIPIYDTTGEIDVAIFAYLRDAFEEVHAPTEYIHLRLKNDEGLHNEADKLINRRRDAGKDPFYPRAILVPDLKNDQVKLSQRFADAVRYGSRGVPVIVAHEDELASQVDFVQAGGFFLPGLDSDYHPVHYNGDHQGPDEQFDLARDRLVQAIVRTAYADDIPFFGICSGIQGLAIFNGHGYKLHQDLQSLGRHKHASNDDHHHTEHFDATRLETNERPTHRKPGARQKAKKYKAAHNVHFGKGSFISALLGNQDSEHIVAVNSSHRQAIHEESIGPEISIEGTAPDGTIEAVHDRQGRFILGVQFHPEALFMDNVTQQPLEKKLYRRLFYAFGQALQGWNWRDIIHPRPGTANWRNRGMSRVYMTPVDSIRPTPEFVTGLREHVLIP